MLHVSNVKSEVTDTGSATNDEIRHVDHDEHSVRNELKADSSRLQSGFRSGSVDTNANVVDTDGDSSSVIFYVMKLYFFGDGATVNSL